MVRDDDPNQPAVSYDDRPLHAAYRGVPEIGQGWRWYDVPYRLLSWAARSWLGRRLPRRTRYALNSALNFLLRFNDHDRNKVWDRGDRMHNLVVEPSQRVFQPDIWVVEFFPPSELPRLERALHKAGWDSQRLRYGFGDGNRQALQKAREYPGRWWWRIGALERPGSGYHNPEAHIGRLPDGFDSIELTGVTVGPSLTAVVAHVELSKAGRDVLNAIWHGPHEPALTWRGRHLHAEDRQWAAFRRTQSARRAAHDTARRWLRSQCPGAFASGSADQPVLDLLLLSPFDPLAESDSHPATDLDHESLRALAIGDLPYRLQTPALPGLLLEEVEDGLHPVFAGASTWTLWGNDVRAAAGAREEGYGSDPVHAVGLRHDEAIRNIAIGMALLELLRLRLRQNARARDSARTQHRRFRRRRALRLRDDFLRSSLDSSMIVRDVLAYCADERRRLGLRRSPHPRLREHGIDVPDDVDADITQTLRHRAEELAAFDADYRAIMGTVATLGMAATALLTQRVALLLAASSLAVALVALLSK